MRNKITKRLKVNRNNLNSDYTIFIPIFGHSKYLEGLKPIRKYGSKVLLVTTDQETDEFYNALEEQCRLYGFKILRVSFNNFKIPKKSSISITKFGVKYVKTKYMIRMDADSIPGDDLDILFGNIEKHGLDLVSVRVLPLPEQNGKLVYDIQNFEYQNAMDVRSVYPYLTSGAAISGKTKVFQTVMPNHSCFFYGEDIEFGKIAWSQGYKIDYLEFPIYTEVPSTFKSLWKQRVDWIAGGFRHAVINFGSNSPFNFLYFTIIVFLMAPFRLWFTLTHFWIYPLIYSLYVFFSCIIFFKNVSWFVFAFPIYSFIQSSILPVIAVFKYIERVHKFKTFGIFKTTFLLSKPKVNSINK